MIAKRADSHCYSEDFHEDVAIKGQNRVSN